MEFSPASVRGSYRRQLALAFLWSLLLPVLLLVFFLCAPHWLERRLHQQAAKEIREGNLPAWEKAQRADFFARLDFEKVCAEPPPFGMEEWHARFVKSGMAGRFHRLEWGEGLSVALVLLLLGSAAVLFLLDERARQAPRELVFLYRMGWRVGIGSALLGMLLLVPLLSYGAFEFTLLLFSVFFPKLIVLFILCGVAVLWGGITILMRKVPLEFPQPGAREVGEAEAPELWAFVRRAAERLGMSPPDRMIVGVGYGFYVTELAVCLESGKTSGKTLFLSHPLLRLLSEEEVLAIIGHELAHFAGEDTRITREFYSLRFKVQWVMAAMAQARLVAWPALSFLRLFTLCFEETIQRFSRGRELEADRTGASLTSSRTMARALVRVHAFKEALQSASQDAAHLRRPDPFEEGLRVFIAERLAPDEAFWTRLLEGTLSHPLDTHPPLRVRLENLGEEASPSFLREMTLGREENAYGRLFPGREALFAGIAAWEERTVLQARTIALAAAPEAGTAEERAWLEEQFPTVTWRIAPKAFRFFLVMEGLFAVFGVVVTVSALSKGGKDAWVPLVCFGGISSAIGAWTWRNLHGRRLTLTATGLEETRWNRPLLFSEVRGLSANVGNGGLCLVFHLKEKQPLRVWGWFFKKQSDRVELMVSQWERPMKEIVPMIERYWLKRTG